MSGSLQGFTRRDEGRGTTLVRDDLAHVSSDALWAAGEPLAAARGRGGARLLEFDGVRLVARDYRRGGALGGLLGDRYMDSQRAARELEVLATLHRRGVPVVAPAAALSRPAGVGHRLRILTELAVDAEPLPAFVESKPDLRRLAVRAAGAAVAQAFDAGLVHLDLHADNLLARACGARVEVILIDLDRARLRERLAPRDRDAMLLRLARYQFRHRERIRTQRVDFVRFLAGMARDRGERRTDVARLAPALRRMLTRHGIAAGLR